MNPDPHGSEKPRLVAVIQSDCGREVDPESTE
jgi:hypothetical protein